MTSLFAELKRRNVFRVAIAYLVIAWLVLQVGETLAPALHLPEWVDSLLAFFLILGFPIAIFFAWAFEMTPEGIKKEKEVDRSQSITHVTGRKLDYSIIALLAAGLAYFAWQHWIVEPAADMATEVVQTTSPSIAILPFDNMSSDPEQEYFSDGLSEELLNLLAKIPELRVTSRSSSFAFKGKEITVPDFAAALGVAYVLEGSVRKSGNTIRITAQLIKAEDDFHLWSETWDRTLDDIFAIQDEIALAVVDQLRIELLGEAPHVATTTGDAYALYLRGIQQMYQRTEPGLKAADRYFRQALEIDPDYAPAWAALGRTYVWGSAIGTVVPIDGMPLAREAANNALLRDPKSPLARVILSSVASIYEFDMVAAREIVEQLLIDYPNDVNALVQAANIAYVLGEAEKAAQLSGNAVALDPLDAGALRFLGWSEMAAGNYDAAIKAFRRSLEVAPSAVGVHSYISDIHIQRGEFDKALEEASKEASDGFEYCMKSIIYYELGDMAQSDANLAALNELPVDWAYQRLQVYAHRGELDKAFEWFDTAIEIRDLGLNRAVLDRHLTKLYDDPRYEEMLERLNRKPRR